MPATTDPRPLHRIPFLSAHAVTGDSTAWGETGLRLLAFAEDAGEAIDPALVRAEARLAWNEHGLAVLVAMRSSAPWVETSAGHAVYQDDSVELFVRHGTAMVQPVFAPGMAPEHPEPRIYVWDYREPAATWKAVPMAVKFGRRRLADGFALEALIPWTAIGLAAKPGAVCEFRIHLNKRLPGWGRRQLVWRGLGGEDFHRLELAQQASAAIDTAAWLHVDPEHGVSAMAVAPAAAANARFRVLRGDTELAAAAMQVRDGRAEGWLAMPVAIADGRPLSIRLGEHVVGGGTPRPARELLRDALIDATAPPTPWTRHAIDANAGLTAVVPRVPSLLIDVALPSASIPAPHLAALAGITAIETRWFNADFAEVASAVQPGRHGAMITVRLEGAEPLVLHRTAWRPAGDQPMPAGDALAAALGVPGRGAALAAAFPGDAVLGALAARPFTARLLAGLAAAPAGELPRVEARDLAWWHALRTRLGTPTRYEYFRLLPTGYADDPGRRWPAVLFLHGSQGRFPRDYPPFARRDPKRDLHGWAMGRNLPFAIYSLASHGTWEPPAMIDALERILAEDRIDPDRVVLMGFSMGGMGTWDCAVDHPDRWAAAVPLGGRGDRAADMARVKDLPIWVFNGDVDMATQLVEAQRGVDALRAVGGNPRFTVMPGVDHNATQDTAFATPGLWEWLAERRRTPAPKR